MFSISKMIFILLFLLSLNLYENHAKVNGQKTIKKCINCANSLFDDYQVYSDKLSAKSLDITFDNDVKNEQFLNQSLGTIEKKFESFNEFYSKLSSNLSPIEKKLKLSAFESLYSIDLNNECFSAIYRWFEAIKDKELWAYQSKFNLTNYSYFCQIKSH